MGLFLSYDETVQRTVKFLYNLFGVHFSLLLHQRRLGTFISFPFFAMKKEKKRKQRKGKLAIIMNESSETTFPNLPFNKNSKEFILGRHFVYHYCYIVIPNLFRNLATGEFYRGRIVFRVL